MEASSHGLESAEELLQHTVATSRFGGGGSCLLEGDA